MVNGQGNAVLIDCCVFRQQAQCGHIHGDDVLGNKSVLRPIGRGIRLIGGGDFGVVKEVRRLSHVTQRPAQCRRAADGIAIGPHMGQKQQIVPFFQIVDDLLHDAYS